MGSLAIGIVAMPVGDAASNVDNGIRLFSAMYISPNHSFVHCRRA